MATRKKTTRAKAKPPQRKPRRGPVRWLDDDILVPDHVLDLPDDLRQGRKGTMILQECSGINLDGRKARITFQRACLT